MPVVDASVVAEYLAGAEHAQAARAAVLTELEFLWAPHLVDAEVGHVLRRAAASGAIDPARATAALGDLVALPIHRVPHLGLLARAFELRPNLSFYDALYVALAERLEMPLITFDARLLRAAQSVIEVRSLAS
ncbi:MAG: type II toxin-antitoxin system VapC family toxin [Solirubrobacteraceae bacterium]